MLRRASSPPARRSVNQSTHSARCQHTTLSKPTGVTTTAAACWRTGGFQRARARRTAARSRLTPDACPPQPRARQPPHCRYLQLVVLAVLGHLGRCLLRRLCGRGLCAGGSRSNARFVLLRGVCAPFVLGFLLSAPAHRPAHARSAPTQPTGREAVRAPLGRGQTRTAPRRTAGRTRRVGMGTRAYPMKKERMSPADMVACALPLPPAAALAAENDRGRTGFRLCLAAAVWKEKNCKKETTKSLAKGPRFIQDGTRHAALRRLRPRHPGERRRTRTRGDAKLMTLLVFHAVGGPLRRSAAPDASRVRVPAHCAIRTRPRRAATRRQRPTAPQRRLVRLAVGLCDIQSGLGSSGGR